MQMIIYGGAASGNQGLLKDELYILDLRREYNYYYIGLFGKSLMLAIKHVHQGKDMGILCFLINLF